MTDDFDDLAYHRDHVSALIMGGFFNEDDLETYLADMAFDPDAVRHASAVRDHARAMMNDKRAAEQHWSGETDCDRLDRAFDALEKGGILALHNAGVTTSDAHSDGWDLIGRDKPGTWRGFAFYHGQDVERAVGGGGLFIGFDAVAKGAEAKQAIGDAIVAALAAEGFAANWNRDPETRVEVPSMLWERRTRWVRPDETPPPAAVGNGLWRKLFG